MKNKSGFTLVELLVTLAIISILAVVIFNALSNFRKNQALTMDTETVVEILRQARNQTLTSKNSSVYGVHFASPDITIFTGAVYDPNSTTNIKFVLSSTDTILSVNLNGAGSDVIFKRLTGETDQYGTVVISSPQISKTKTVTIYKTGLVEN